MAKEPVADHRGEFTRYRLVCKRVDRRGRSDYQAHIAGINDVVVIHDAETYAVGQHLTWEGLDHVVLRDLGDDGVEVGVPEHTRKPRGYGVIHIPSGNVRVLHKADLILAGMH